MQRIKYLLGRDARFFEDYLGPEVDENKDITSDCNDSAPSVDEAVGVSGGKWFIAIVNSRGEKSVAGKLSKLGVENYLPVQEEIHIWANGKRAKVEKVLIPSKVFIHCTEQRRREIVNLPYIFRFMTNISGEKTKSGFRPLAVVPDYEIRQLKFMLGASDGEVTFSESFVKGQKIEVIRGPLRGLVGEITKDADSGVSRLCVNISCLGCASVTINPKDVKPIDDSPRH